MVVRYLDIFQHKCCHKNIWRWH